MRVLFEFDEIPFFPSNFDVFFLGISSRKKSRSVHPLYFLGRVGQSQARRAIEKTFLCLVGTVAGGVRLRQVMNCWTGGSLVFRCTPKYIQRYQNASRSGPGSTMDDTV